MLVYWRPGWEDLKRRFTQDVTGRQVGAADQSPGDHVPALGDRARMWGGGIAAFRLLS